MRRPALFLPVWFEALRLTLVAVSGGAGNGAISGSGIVAGIGSIGGMAAPAMG